MDIDTGRSPEPHRLSPTSDPESIPTLDGWIESLMSCKQLAENDVQRLCDRVGFPRWSLCCDGRCNIHRVDLRALTCVISRLERCYKTNPTSSQWYVNYRASFFLGLTMLDILALADAMMACRNALSLCAVISMGSSTT